ncbi:MAG: sulfatase-like hydrolase/transferase [Bacteroidota bacterium]
MLFCLALAGTSFAQKKKRPNILFIMSDDHTSQAFGVYGSRLAKLNPTPTIDRLAHEGMLFENAFCTNSICTPSRATIMTGQYSQTNGVQDLNGRLAPENQYLAREMKKLGYETAMVGKWHLKEEPASFDYFNVLYGQGSYFDPILFEKGETEMIDINRGKKVDMRPGRQYKGHSSDVITDASLKWLKERDGSQPFFLMHHFKAPHDMFQFAPRYADYLENTEIPEPASLYNNRNNGSVGTKGTKDVMVPHIGSSVSKRNQNRNMGQHMKIDPNLPDDEYTHEAYQEYLKRYLRCVKGVDDNVKRIFDFLEENDMMDNTIIVYTGDQGFMLGEHDYIDKRWMYEESMRMPFLVRYPKTIEAGTRTNALINNTDFAPTLIELAGGKKPKYMQGNSFKEILETGKEPKNWRDATYYRYWMHMAHAHANPAHFGVRTKDYKLIFYYGSDYIKRKEDGNWPNDRTAPFSTRRPFEYFTPPAWELYDLKNDPFEMNNLFGEPGYEGITEDLKAKLLQLREELNETDEDYPFIQEIIDKHWNLKQNRDAPIDTLKMYNEQRVWNALYPRHHRTKTWRFVDRHPETPNVLIVGNSISIGYTEYVKSEVNWADVCRVPENCAETSNFLKKHRKFLGDGDWDVIHFNFGLHDLKRLMPEGKLDKTRKAERLVPVEQYKENLEKIIQILKGTGARLVFATTTIVPPEAPGRIKGDEVIYNKAAIEVLQYHPDIVIDDQYTTMLNFPEGRKETKDVHHYAWGSAKLGIEAGKIIKDILKEEGKWHRPPRK